MVVGALIPQLEVTFVMPSQSPGKESSGGDVESFLPDSSSIADDGVIGSSATVWQTSTLSIAQDSFNRRSNNANEIMRNQSDTTRLSHPLEFPQSSPELNSKPFNFSKKTNANEMLMQSDMAGYNARQLNYSPNDADLKSRAAMGQQPFTNINIQNNFNAGEYLRYGNW